MSYPNSTENVPPPFIDNVPPHCAMTTTVVTNIHPSSLNSPHPSIEYPPLYFVIRRFPRIMNAIQSLYHIRWEIKYPLQRRVPFSKPLRNIGITCTWGELLLWMPCISIAVMGMVTSFVYPSVSKSGVVSRLPLILCFLTANHNSLLTLLLGISFERAIKYHKAFGYLAFVNGTFHTIVAYIAYVNKDNIGKNVMVIRFATDGQVNMSGTLLLLIILSMIITSFPYVRRKAFEVFYYFHILFAMAMMGCAFYHSGILVPVLASTLWGGDLLIRIVYMAHFRYPSEARIKQLTETVVEIRFPKTSGFDYNPGQYVKIAVPDISLFQWHPISISSSPHQQTVTLHIRKRGRWTTRLHELAHQKKEGTIPILLEGPYGSLDVDLLTKTTTTTRSDHYSMVMLLSGGIGVSPMQSIANQLMYEHECGERELKKLWFIWTARDPQVMSNMTTVLSSNSTAAAAAAAATNVITMHHDDENTKTRTRTRTNSTLISFHQEQQDNVVASNTIISRRGSIVSESDSSTTSIQIISQHALAMMPPCNTTDKDLEQELPMLGEEDFEETETDTGEEEHGDGDGDGSSFTIATDSHDATSSFSSSSSRPSSSSDILELDCYITAREMSETGMTGSGSSSTTTTRIGGLADDLLPFVKQCRPDMKGIFMKMREEAKRRGEKRVAICACAPMRLVDVTRKACIKFSDRDVRFDFHSEVFDF